MDEIKIIASDGLELSCLYSKAENPKALVQIMHGMEQHGINLAVRLIYLIITIKHKQIHY